MTGRGSLARGASACALAVLTPSPALAHAFAQRYDLPLPLSFFIVGGGIAVFASFVILALIFTKPRTQENLYTARLASWDATATAPRLVKIVVVELPVVLLFAFLIYAGFEGFQRNPNLNILPTMIWVVWWVGLAFAAALIGNIWDAINPWSIVAKWVGAAMSLGGSTSKPPLTFASWVGAWPAFILFAGFAWMEVAWTPRIVPEKLATAILIYSAITWAGMALFGRRPWLEHAEAFTQFFGTFARFAIFSGRAREGRIEIVARPPAVGLLSYAKTSFSHMAFILLIFSTVTFDGISETPFWQDIADWLSRQDFIWPVLLKLSYLTGGTSGVQNTLGLILVFSVFLCVYLVFSGLVAAAGGGRRPTLEVASIFIASLVPIAIAYHLAHFLPFLLIFGQSIIPLMSNPLGVEGVDLFGTAGYKVNIGLIGAKFSWFSAAIAIVIGHIAAVFVAHITALRLFAGARAALASQIPMIVLMVCYTMLSLWILAQPVIA